MKQITFPLSAGNIAEVVAERDAEIERLRAALEEIIEIDDDGRTGKSIFSHIARKVLLNQQYGRKNESQ